MSPSSIKVEMNCEKIDGYLSSGRIATKDGKYYVSILVETEEPRNKVIEPKSKACGIDLELEHFATITNDFGTYKVEHPIDEVKPWSIGKH